MTGAQQTKFKGGRSFASSEAAARELLRIYRNHLKGDASHASTGVTNNAFIQASGGSVEEYKAGRDYGIGQKWFRIDESGTRVFLLPGGEDVLDDAKAAN